MGPAEMTEQRDIRPLAPPHNIPFNYFYNASEEEVNGNYVQPPVVVEGVVSFPLFPPLLSVVLLEEFDL